MSVEVMESSMFGKVPGPGCDGCGAERRIAFNWALAREKPDHELHGAASHLKHIKALRKSGQLFACDQCGRNWVLDDDGKMMTRVAAGQVALLNEWNERALTLTAEQLRVLREIGGVGVNFWLGRYGVIQFPCAVVTESGERLDPAMVWISKRPPVDKLPGHLRFCTDIRTVEPTVYALPVKVRVATARAGEVAMGFAPTRVLAANGRPYVLHWATTLFNEDGIAGKDISLSFRPFSRGEQIPVAKGGFDSATYFLADWFDGAELMDLGRRKPKRFQRKNTSRAAGAREGRQQSMDLLRDSCGLALITVGILLGGASAIACLGYVLNKFSPISEEGVINPGAPATLRDIAMAVAGLACGVLFLRLARRIMIPRDLRRLKEERNRY